MTPKVVEMMVAGLVPLDSELRKSTSIGSAVGEKNVNLP